MSEEQKSYTPVEDGYHNDVHPAYVEIIDDYFNEESTQVKLAFFIEEGFEQPVAKIPFVMAPGHKIAEWENGEKTERKATEQDQRDAMAFLARIFPAWGAFCREGHPLDEKLGWFESHADEVKATRLDIRVKHSTTGFPNAYVMDPAKSKKAAKKTVSSSACKTRAAAALASLFGGGAADGGGADDGADANAALPF